MNIYVGNLSRNVTEQELREAFEAFGQVATATIIKDKFSGESKGFGFVEMPTAAEAQSAIQGLNGKDLKGRAVNVSEARPRSDDRRDRGGPRRSGGPPRSGGGGGGGRRRF
jgi:RNA recognition motif-containing protein